MHNKRQGFTLLEVLLSVALITLIVGFGAPVYQSFQVRNDLDVAANTISSSLRRAQALSQSGDGDSSWGLSIQSGAITLFQGDAYDTRNSNFDELFDLPGSITPSGLSQVVFDRFTGEPQEFGTITLVSSINEGRNIVVNGKGMVDISSFQPVVPPDDPLDLDISYETSFISDWGDGFCTDVIVSTESEEPIVWELAIDLSTYPLNGEPYSVWNADWAFFDETLTVSGESWNNEVVAGSPQEFGFCANRPAAPSGEVDYAFDITVDWETGYCVDVYITTESVTPISWEVHIPLNDPPTDGTPYNVWNAIWSFSDNILTASGVSWNDEVMVSDPQRFGFCANR